VRIRAMGMLSMKSLLIVIIFPSVKMAAYGLFGILDHYEA